MKCLFGRFLFLASTVVEPNVAKCAPFEAAIIIIGQLLLLFHRVK